MIVAVMMIKNQRKNRTENKVQSQNIGGIVKQLA